jgi:xanthine dehydrogenase accessory factor
MTMGCEMLAERLRRLAEEQQPFVLATVVRAEGLTSAKAGAKAIYKSDGAMEGWIGGGCAQGAVRGAAAEALADGRPRLVRVSPDVDAAANSTESVTSHCPSGGTLEIFIEPMSARPALIVLGDSPVAKALRELAGGVDFQVTAATQREDFVRLVEAETGVVRVQSPYIVVATQGAGDGDALAAALTTGASYVAFVASRAKAAAARQDLLSRGFAPERVAAVRAPAGLDIGAATAGEIALSILAEIVSLRRARQVRPAAAEIVPAVAEIPQPRPARASCCDHAAE